MVDASLQPVRHLVPNAHTCSLVTLPAPSAMQSADASDRLGGSAKSVGDERRAQAPMHPCL